MKYSIFNRNGQFSRLLDCDSADLLYNVKSDERAILGDYQNSYINSDGRLVEVEQIKESELEVAKAEAFRLLKLKHSELLDSGYRLPSEQERNTWFFKLKAAKESIELGYPTDEAITLFYSESLEDNVSVMTKCQRSVTRNDLYMYLIGIASGFKAKFESLISTAVSTNQIEEIIKRMFFDLDEAIQQYILTTEEVLK